MLEVENFEVEEGQELKDPISIEEKNKAINDFLVIEVVESEKAATGKRTTRRKDT